MKEYITTPPSSPVAEGQRLWRIRKLMPHEIHRTIACKPDVRVFRLRAQRVSSLHPDTSGPKRAILLLRSRQHLSRGDQFLTQSNPLRVRRQMAAGIAQDALQ